MITFLPAGDCLTTNSFSQSQSHFTTGGLPPISSSWRQAPWDLRQDTCGYSPYVTSSLTREWVCRLLLLLVLASAVILGSGSRGTHGQILLSQIRDSPNLEDQVPVFISPRNRVAQLYSQALGFLFVASYDSQGYDGGIRSRLHIHCSSCPAHNFSACAAQKTPFVCRCIQLSWKRACLRNRYLVTTVVYLSRGRCPAAGIHATIWSRRSRRLSITHPQEAFFWFFPAVICITQLVCSLTLSPDCTTLS
jgi:hypothetical protein